MRRCLARFAVARSSSFALPVLAALVALLGLLGLLGMLPGTSVTPATAAAAEPPVQSAAAATPATPAAPAATDSQAKMKADMDAMMKLAQPGEHHKRLDLYVGKWKVTGKSWMDPSQPPTEFSGTMESSWQLGGRYLESVHKSAFFGMPFEGRSIAGYDNATHEYFNTWIDTMGTGVEIFRGTCEDPCKVLTETAEFFDPMAGKVMKSKEVTTFVDPDTYRMEMYMVGATPDGKDVKVMELMGKRDK
ncbi:MAG: DUF1579 domain-containing protein [Acidobacteria bacterium]|nr:DUF1579 domain-containing protein [Acidobacteriota bacterium]